MTDIVSRLHEAALPYGADLVKGAAAVAANNLTAAASGELGRIDLVMTNLERTTLAIADAHAGCRRKRCRVCDGIRIMLVEHLALRTCQLGTLTNQTAH